MSTEVNNELGLPLTLKEVCELHDWTYSSETRAVKRIEKQLGELYDYTITGKGKSKRYILHNVKQQTTRQVKRTNKQGKTTGFGKRAVKPKAKTKNKHYSEYVYNGTQDVPVECLIVITKEDIERHNKYSSLVEVNKDYTQKELCELFDEVVETSGRGRTLQLSYWWQSFEWEEHKQSGKATKYHVTKIFKEPRQRIDYSLELTNFKEQSLEVNFVLSIVNSNNLHEEVSDFGLITAIKAREFYQNIGLVNSDYYFVRSQKEVLADWLPITEQQTVYRDIDESSKRYTMGALKRLLKQRVIIDYSYTYIWFEVNKTEHLATDKEHLVIENAVRETIKHAQEVGFDKVKNVCNLYDNTLTKAQQQDLHDYLIELVQKDIPTLSYYCRGYKLVYLKEPMLEYVNDIATKEGIEVLELGILKKDSSHKEHTSIQVGKFDKRRSNNKDKKVKLINTIVDLPRNENTSDRHEILSQIELQQRIDYLVQQGQIEEAEELIYQQQQQFDVETQD